MIFSGLMIKRFFGKKRTRCNPPMHVALIHKAVWDFELLSVPLAAGYMKAYALQDPKIKRDYEIHILNFCGGATTLDILDRLISSGSVPDIVGFSAYGWNYKTFGRVAETLKMMAPDSLCVFGGPHVSNQAEKVFREFPCVDIVVNGEGEISFYELLRKVNDGSTRGLSEVPGISFRGAHQQIITTQKPSRIQNLDQVPSPFLTGAIPLVDEQNEFLYDAITMETNRGCPYKCSFCNWGGANASRVFKFGSDRLREELTLFASVKVENVCLADANFGMLPNDEVFLDAFLDVREKYDYPKTLTASWAKNKGTRFFRMVDRMKEAGLSTDFTLALQTLSEGALITSQRTNMKVNKFKDLCTYLDQAEAEVYAELIWQLPGETFESFIEGYDNLSQHVTRIATYNNLIMPNTHYYDNRSEYKLVTVQQDDHDFGTVLSHSTMSYSDNVRMHHFLFWARLIPEYMYFRKSFSFARSLGIKQSALLFCLDNWVESQSCDTARYLIMAKQDVVGHLDVTRMARPIRFLYESIGVQDFFERWWYESALSLFAPEVRILASEVFKLDQALRPVHKNYAKTIKRSNMVINGITYYSPICYSFAHNPYEILTIARQFESDGLADVDFAALNLELVHKVGFENHIDNHEIISQYFGVNKAELDLNPRMEPVNENYRHVVGLPDKTLSLLNL